MNAEANRAVERGRRAWKRIKTDSTWEDWCLVGQALDLGRAECMSLSGTNQPQGRAYNEMFSRWLDGNGFGDIDKAARSNLAQCMERRGEIEAWRAALPLAERLRLNHPSSVLRKFLATRRTGRDSKASTPATLKAEIVRLEEENRRLKENGGSQYSRSDSAKDIAKVLYDELPEPKLKAVIEAAFELLELSKIEQAKMRDEVKARVLRDAKL